MKNTSDNRTVQICCQTVHINAYRSLQHLSWIWQANYLPGSVAQLVQKGRCTCNHLFHLYKWHHSHKGKTGIHRCLQQIKKKKKKRMNRARQSSVVNTIHSDQTWQCQLHLQYKVCDTRQWPVSNATQLLRLIHLISFAICL